MDKFGIEHSKENRTNFFPNSTKADAHIAEEFFGHLSKQNKKNNLRDCREKLDCWDHQIRDIFEGVEALELLSLLELKLSLLLTEFQSELSALSELNLSLS